MNNAAVRKVSMNGGVMSPYLDARIDLARFQTSLLESDNQIPTDSGLSWTRPGLMYGFRPNRPTVIFEYIVSYSVSYFLLFSELELRIVRDNELIQVDGEDLVIETPYGYDELFELSIDSLVDVIWIAHPDHLPRQLSRVDETEWDLIEIPFLNPPMIPRAAEAVKLTPSATTGTITITSDQPDFFFDAHVGSYWRIGHDLDSQSEQLSLDYSSGGPYYSSWLPVSGDWSFTTGGNWIADLDIERRFSGEESTIRSFKARSSAENISTTGTEQEGSELRIKASNFEGYSQDGTVQAPAFRPSAAINVSNTELYGLVRITAVTDGQTATAEVVRDLYSTDETDLWEEGAWSDFRGYPGEVQVHEERIIFLGSRSFPNRFWASAQQDRQDFMPGDETQSAFAFDLPTRDAITGVLSDRSLHVFTRRSEIVVSSGRDDLALSSENRRARIISSEGSSRLAPFKSGNAVLYAERHGKRVRQLIDTDGAGSYVNTDLTAFAPHLFDAPIIQTAYAQIGNQKLNFYLLSNGKVIGHNHNNDQQVSAFFPVTTDGIFESVAALPGNFEDDQVAFMVRREINGETVHQFEYLAGEQWEAIEQGESKCLVCSDMAKVLEEETAFSEITGLEEWEGKELVVLGDGSVQNSKTVTNGAIILDEEVNTAVIGITMPSTMTPMWFEDVNTPTQGRLKKITKAYVAMYSGGNTTLQATDDDAFGDLQAGEELQEEEMQRRVWSDATGEAPGLETGYYTFSLESRHSRRQSIRFTRTAPLPMIIQALHVQYKNSDK